MHSPAAATRKARWIVLALGGALLVLAGLLLARSRAAPAFRGPARHVIFISLDTTRADHMGFYGAGWMRTPRLDALVAESIILDDYMTVATTTLASHTSLMTGKYPQAHGVPRNGFMVPADNVMLAETLRAAGFRTAGVLGSFALDSRFDFAQGFEHFDEQFDTLVGEGGADQNQRDAAAVTDAVIGYLGARPASDNLFLFVHYFDPHWPYAAPAPYDQMYSPDNGGAGLPIEEHPALRLAPRDAQTRRQLAAYAGEVSYLDAQVGRLLDDLRRRGILDEALLVVTSDHGENLTENWGRPFDHGWSVYQIEQRAIGLIRLPGAARAGARVSQLVASIDMAPTVLRYLGLPPPQGADGVALDLARLELVRPVEFRFGEASKPWEQVETDPRWFNLRKPRCVRSGSFKYIRTGYLNREELYDLDRDPYEQRNLLPAPAEDVGAVADRLRAALDEFDRAAAPPATRFESSQREETLRRLKALGYLGGSESSP